MYSCAISSAVVPLLRLYQSITEVKPTLKSTKISVFLFFLYQRGKSYSSDACSSHKAAVVACTSFSCALDA